MTKPLNIGMIGYGFMGRAHSNAYAKVNHFFDLDYRPVLKAVCARSLDKVKPFADTWGYESVETDWRKLVDGRCLRQYHRRVFSGFDRRDHLQAFEVGRTIKASGIFGDSPRGSCFNSGSNIAG